MLAVPVFQVSTQIGNEVIFFRNGFSYSSVYKSHRITDNQERGYSPESRHKWRLPVSSVLIIQRKYYVALKDFLNDYSAKTTVHS